MTASTAIAHDSLPGARELFRELDSAGSDPLVYLIRGRSGTGKSTLLSAVRHRLRGRGIVSCGTSAEAAAGNGSRPALIVDDAHTLGPDELEKLCATVESGQYTMVLAARPRPHDPALRALTAAVSRRGRVIDLRTLGVADIAPFARELGMMVPRPVAQHIHGRTAGIHGGVVAALSAACATRLEAGIEAVDEAVIAWARTLLDDTDQALLDAFVIASTGTGLDPVELAEVLDMPADAAADLIDRARASALVTDADLLLALAVAPLRTLVGDRRFLAVQRRLLRSRLEAGLLRNHTALLLAEGGVRDSRLAEFLCGAAETAGNEASRYYAAAAASGLGAGWKPTPAETVRWAEAAARLGNGDLALRLTEPILAGPDSPATELAAAVRICSGVWIRRGLPARAAELYSWLGPHRVGADWAAGSTVLYLAGETDRAAAMSASATLWPPTEATARANLIATAVARSLTAPAAPDTTTTVEHRTPPLPAPQAVSHTSAEESRAGITDPPNTNSHNADPHSFAISEVPETQLRANTTQPIDTPDPNGPATRRNAAETPQPTSATQPRADAPRAAAGPDTSVATSPGRDLRDPADPNTSAPHVRDHARETHPHTITTPLVDADRGPADPHDTVEAHPRASTTPPGDTTGDPETSAALRIPHRAMEARPSATTAPSADAGRDSGAVSDRSSVLAAASTLIQAARSDLSATETGDRFLPYSAVSIATLLCLSMGEPRRAADALRGGSTVPQGPAAAPASDAYALTYPETQPPPDPRPTPDPHLLVLSAWASMLGGDEQAAAALLAALPLDTLPARDRLLAHGALVGLARRSGDHAALTLAWQAAHPLFDDVGVDLLALLPIGELWLAGIRLRDEGRIDPLVDAAGKLLHRLGIPPAWSNVFHWYGIQAAIAHGRPDELMAPARHLQAAARAGDPHAAALAGAGRTWVLVLRGEVVGDRVTTAVRGLAGIGMAWDAARLAGDAALAADDSATATALLKLARTVRTESRPPQPPIPAPAPVHGPGPAAVSRDAMLSEREREVAELVLLGLTYREIGARLYISAKTVEHHVARIRRRIGAGSRSELLSMLRAMGHGSLLV
ncbi:LuxR C-terminal-related transcriptional regulator [Nocardia mexicana]|uniref:DNA-binding CsgD family transcriptional regulator n=1 Tax=Nocardia mexicana TaxID=279262 RepID=A0A370GTP6_9NOCA|nr:LuxR C-terminal-related transcriptional regulator [Nocardia mexicana]RDI46680.1 DNA-binding CsgD family transcriptional regulator [Nocardia mexicana]